MAAGSPRYQITNQHGLTENHSGFIVVRISKKDEKIKRRLSKLISAISYVKLTQQSSVQVKSI